MSEAAHNVSMLEKYVESLSEKELKAYHIAKTHLGTSFSLEKSRGFIEWKKKMSEPPNVIPT